MTACAFRFLRQPISAYRYRLTGFCCYQHWMEDLRRQSGVFPQKVLCSFRRWVVD
jgi:hypothetical protein